MIEQANIRNFCIIAHIDHGKSTLADRFLELTGTVPKREMREQFLDQMDLEREKGITIKLQPVRMTYEIKNPKSEIRNPKQIQNPNDQNPKQPINSFEPLNFKFRNYLGFSASNLEFANSRFILNLIDTPGHVDFTYEVSRSLAAVEGVILLVDATQGIQAQTLANLYLAIEQNLTIIPVVNKIDLPNARIEETREELINFLGCKKEEIILASAKTGEGTEEILYRLIEKVPPPSGKTEGPLRALIFDSSFDKYKGVVVYVRIVDGQIRKGDKIRLLGAQKESEVLEIGIFKPRLTPQEELLAGEIGYVVTGFKEIRHSRVGDTIASLKIKNQKSPKESKLPTGQAKKQLPEMLIDSEKIKEAIYNIIDNSIRYTQKGGITIKCKMQNSKCKIEVSDTGTGLTEDELSKLFESFSRGAVGSRLYSEGVGLGLYIARKFIEMHNGTIRAESEGKGKGSSFCIELAMK